MNPWKHRLQEGLAKSLSQESACRGWMTSQAGSLHGRPIAAAVPAVAHGKKCSQWPDPVVGHSVFTCSISFRDLDTQAKHIHSLGFSRSGRFPQQQANSQGLCGLLGAAWVWILGAGCQLERPLCCAFPMYTLDPWSGPVLTSCGRGDPGLWPERLGLECGSVLSGRSIIRRSIHDQVLLQNERRVSPACILG